MRGSAADIGELDRDLLRFLNCTDKSEAFARQCLDEALFLARVTDCAPSGIQARRKRRFGHDTTVPNGLIRSSLLTTRSLLRIR